MREVRGNVVTQAVTQALDNLRANWPAVVAAFALAIIAGTQLVSMVLNVIETLNIRRHRAESAKTLKDVAELQRLSVSALNPMAGERCVHGIPLSSACAHCELGLPVVNPHGN